jgi:hypothetical protein
MPRWDPIERRLKPRCPQPDDPVRRHEHRLERLFDRLPERLQSTVRWLRRPSSRWVRIPAGLLLVVASLLSILPFFGLWMLPLGLMLLAEDVPPLRRARERLLAWIERRRPNWFTTKPAGAAQAVPPSSPQCGRTSLRRTS